MEVTALNQAWKDIVHTCKSYDSVDASEVEAIFSRLQPQAMSEGFLMLTSDNSFIKDWVEQRFVDVIKQALTDLRGTNFTVIIAVDSSQSAPDTTIQVSTHSSSNGFASPSSPVQNIATSNFHETISSNTNLRKSPEYEDDFDNDISDVTTLEMTGPTSLLTFENFVIGESNHMAYSMALSIAEAPGKTHLNPLFIYGKSGLGKTHLLHAIQNYIRETQPHLRVVYVDAARFLNDFTDAVAMHDRERLSYRNFQNTYENADILLIDDVQHLQGKKQTLDKLFEIFNNLTLAGKQVVLAADRAPKNIDIDERYQSRFNQGGISSIEPPQIETKLGIIKSHAIDLENSDFFAGLKLESEIQNYIAEISSSNVRELKSAVTKIFYEMLNRSRLLLEPTVTLEEVKTLLEDHFSGGTSKRLTVEDIQHTVEEYYKISHQDIVGKSRVRGIVFARQVAIYLCCTMTDSSLQAIGKKFQKDHTSIIYSRDQMAEKVRNSRDLQEEIENIQRIIRER